MNEEVYIVIGTTGEYSGRSEWPVAWYDNPESADEHQARANEAAAQLKHAFGYTNRWGPEWEAALVKYGIDKLDPSFSQDYTGTTYEVWVIPKGWVTR